MFKAIKDNKIVCIKETNSFPLMIIGKDIDEIVEDVEHTVDDYIHCDGQFVLTDSAEAIDLYKSNVRMVRNELLEQTDKYLSVSDFPITDEEREQYKTYRQYLRDYPETEDWWKANPLSFEDFVKGN